MQAVQSSDRGDRGRRGAARSSASSRSRARARARAARAWWCGPPAPSTARSAAARSNGRRSTPRAPRSRPAAARPRRRTISLGPDLAQCCGGRVQWLIETFDARDARDLGALAAAERAGPFVAEATQARRTGAWRAKWWRRSMGEGAAIEPLPDGGLRERFADQATTLLSVRRRPCRPGAGAGAGAAAVRDALDRSAPRASSPSARPANVAMVHAPEPAAELEAAPDGAQVLVMTHSHPLDLDDRQRGAAARSASPSSA